MITKITTSHLAAHSPEASTTQQRDFLTHLHQMLNAPSHPSLRLRLTAHTSALEREIDQQVYALYGLTPEEIAIVEDTAQ